MSIRREGAEPSPSFTTQRARQGSTKPIGAGKASSAFPVKHVSSCPFPVRNICAFGLHMSPGMIVHSQLKCTTDDVNCITCADTVLTVLDLNVPAGPLSFGLRDLCQYHTAAGMRCSLCPRDF